MEHPGVVADGASTVMNGRSQVEAMADKAASYATAAMWCLIVAAGATVVKAVAVLSPLLSSP